MSSAAPRFVRANPGQKPALYTADVDGLVYSVTAESVRDDRWALSVDGEPLAGNYRDVSSAFWAAHIDLEGRREDAAATHVATFVHPDDGSVLSVSTNGYTELTEVILTDDTNGTHRLVLDLQQVQRLAQALATLDEFHQQARRRGVPSPANS